MPNHGQPKNLHRGRYPHASWKAKTSTRRSETKHPADPPSSSRSTAQCEFVLVCSIKLNSFLNSSFMLLDAPSKARCPVRSLPSLRSVREARASSDRPHLGGRHLHGGLEAGGGTCALWLLRLPGPVRPTRGQSKMWLMLCKVLLATKVVHASSSKTSSTIHSCRASPERSLAQAALR